MKTLFFVSIFVSSFLVTSASRADQDRGNAPADFSTDAEREFELEVQQVEIRDVNDQAAVAEDEAQLQEQLKRQNAEDLKTLEAEKNHLTKKAKSEIANAEYRRVKAEKDAAKYDAEIKTLKRQIASLKDHISQVQAKAEDAEGLAEEERAELNQYREERRALLKKLHDKQTTSKKKAKDLEAYHNAADSNYDF